MDQIAKADVALFDLLLAVSQNVDKKHQQLLSNMDIRRSEYEVLLSLRCHGKPFAMTPNDLLKQVSITSGALTTCVNRLISRKFVIRVQDKKDHRSKPVVLTDKGKQIIDQFTQIIPEHASLIAQPLTDNEKLILRTLLCKLTI